MKNFLLFFGLSFLLVFPASVYAVDCDLAVQINVNTASKEELMCIVQIGDSRADDLISLRSFSSLDDLEEISGISSNRVQEIKNQGIATVNGETIFEESSSEDEETSEENGKEEDDDTDDASSASSDQSSASSEDSAHSSPVSIEEFEVEQVLRISAGRDRFSSVGGDIVFKAYVDDSDTGSFNYSPRSVQYEWNFGDGSVKRGQKVIHSYKHPGRYNVVLNASLRDEEAVSRIVVNVISPEIEIGEANGDLIRIENNSEGEVNLGGWILSSDMNEFEMPRDTIISENSHIIFSSEITGLGEGDKFSLVSPLGEVMSEYKSEVPVENISSDNSNIVSELGEIRREAERLALEIRSRSDVSDDTFVQTEPEDEFTEEIQDEVLEEEGGVADNSLVDVETDELGASAIGGIEVSPEEGIFERVLSVPSRLFNFFR